MSAQFLNAVVPNVGATAVTVLTAPAQSTLIGLSIANLLSNKQITVDVTLTTAGGVTAHLIKNGPVPIGSAMVVIGGEQKLVVAAGDVLKVKSSDAASADVILSFLR